MSETQYETLHLEGAPEVIEPWLETYGWTQEAGIHSQSTDPAISAFGPYSVRKVMGQSVGFILLVLTGSIVVPDGIHESEIPVSGVVMGGPKKPTPLEWIGRLSLERQAEIYVQAQSVPLLSFGLYRLGAAQIVDVSLAETQNMVEAMFQAELISSEEKDILLN